MLNNFYPFCIIGRDKVFKFNVSGLSTFWLMRLKAVFRKIHFWNTQNWNLCLVSSLNLGSLFWTWWVIYKAKKENTEHSCYSFLYICVFTLPFMLQKDGGLSDHVALFIDELIHSVHFCSMPLIEDRLVTLFYLVGRNI